MSIEDPEILDAIGTEISTGQVVLTISDHLGSEDTFHHQRLLQSKIENYVLFVTDERIRETQQRSEESLPRIDVVFPEPPATRISALLCQMSAENRAEISEIRVIIRPL